MGRDTLIPLLREQGCEVLEQAPLCRYTSFRIGGPAALLVTPLNADATVAALRLCYEQGCAVTVIGNGSNLLVGDNGIDGVVLRIGGGTTPPVAEGDGMIACEAALPLKELCRFAREQGLTGLEPLYGIPGTVGGAVYMNAGAYGGEVSQTLWDATAVSLDGTVRVVKAEELALSYRHSALMDSGEIVLSARFRLQPDTREAIGARMDDYLHRRRDKQPLEFPSAGSFFKRPEGYFAGALIEQCGLKGYRVGDAQVSEKHAGFLINRGSATCAQMKELMTHVQQTVKEQHGVLLEPEVRFLGE